MKIHVVMIPVEGPVTFEYVEADGLEGVAEFSRLVGGGYLETLALYEPDAMMWCDADGKNKNFPINPRATMLAHDKSFITNDDFIVGDAFITGPTNPAGSSETVDHWYFDKLVGG